jgi:zinc-ribbon domain
MMYQNRFIASVRVNGKILRENQGTVTLPFGSEFELLLKNMHSRRAMATVSIDGVDVMGGTRLIIGPNDSISLERFIKNGNMSSGNKLKFVERTAGIEEHRGIKQEDGLVRVEFWAEKEKPQEITETIVRRHYVDDYWYVPRQYPWYPYITWTSGIGSVTCGLSGAANYNFAQGSQVTANSCQMNANMNAVFTATNDAGITVPGSESHQNFYSASGFPLEASSTVIVLQLRGEVGGVAAVRPVTVELKPTCSSCGKVNKATNKFCSECGTALFLI